MELRLRAKKGFGQHFLVNPGAIRTIVQAVAESPAARILEIGPGPAVLTRPLMDLGRPLWAVELDPEACGLLREALGGHPGFHLIEGDAVTVDLPPGDPCAIVGNLPYNASTAILSRFLLEPFEWERMVFMFQAEVGHRLLGRPGTRDYGPLSILAQLCCRMERLVKLGPGSFAPPPKVDSVVLLFRPREQAPELAERRGILDLLHRGFAQRRKTLANNLQAWLGPEEARNLLHRAGIRPDLRPEAVDPSGWRTLFLASKPSN